MLGHEIVVRDKCIIILEPLHYTSPGVDLVLRVDLWSVVCASRLNAEDHIQMVTALALQLIQCVVKLPQVDDVQPNTEQHAMDDDIPSKKKKNNDKVGTRLTPGNNH